MCARVCPTETLCEQACVREKAEQKPVEIGALQRFATDTLMARPEHPYTRAEETGKHVAVVGAGSGGSLQRRTVWPCTGTASHSMKLGPRPCCLNEYGIAAYKTVDGFAQSELNWLLGIGGITVENGRALGDELTIESLSDCFDAVFLSIGLGGVNALGAKGEDDDSVIPATHFIEDLRQSNDLSALPIGRRVVVIGGGMTAVDAAVQAKLLGAEESTIVYAAGQGQSDERLCPRAGACSGQRCSYHHQRSPDHGRRRGRALCLHRQW